MAVDHTGRIYISIHETQTGTSVTGLSWRLMVQSTKPSKMFHHAKKPESNIYEPRDGVIEACKLSSENQATQILKILIGETQSTDLASRIQLALSPISGYASIQHQLQRLQQNDIIRKFDLHMFTTIVEDRLRIIMRTSRKDGAEEMNYLSYCQLPAVGSKSVQQGSDYFMSTYDEPAKKTKRHFWVTHGSGQNYRSAVSNDPYGGLM